MIMTRWHLDDPMGRWLQTFAADTKVLRYPALAEEDDDHRKKGEPLFPEFKSLTFLNERKKLYTLAAMDARALSPRPAVCGKPPRLSA